MDSSRSGARRDGFPEGRVILSGPPFFEGAYGQLAGRGGSEARCARWSFPAPRAREPIVRASPTPTKQRCSSALRRRPEGAIQQRAVSSFGLGRKKAKVLSRDRRRTKSERSKGLVVTGALASGATVEI